MRLNWIDEQKPLPPTSRALPAGSQAPGLLAIGGRLSAERLQEAYSRGIFPWYSEGQPVLWWSPDPRMILALVDFKFSRSLRKTVRRFLATPGCEIRFDTAFDRVIEACAMAPRAGQSGTWIVPAMVRAYSIWHRQGRVHSIETWVDGELVGGLYCVALGRMVYGESMFAYRTDASKIALAALAAFCRAKGVAVIDCQQNTRHLASFGAREVSRAAFERLVALGIGGGDIAEWAYDPAHWATLGLGPGDTESPSPARLEIA